MWIRQALSLLIRNINETFRTLKNVMQITTFHPYQSYLEEQCID